MREVWRQAHLKQPLGSVMDPAPVSAAAVASSPPGEAPEAAPPAWDAPGGSYIKLQVRDPMNPSLCLSTKTRGGGCGAGTKPKRVAAAAASAAPEEPEEPDCLRRARRDETLGAYIQSSDTPLTTGILRGELVLDSFDGEESGSSEFELVLLLLLIGGRFDPTRNSGALRRA